MAHSNISIFVPHAGCPHRCSFCDQRSISGAAFQPDGEYVRRICTDALEQISSPEDTEIAFFGGSFTAISHDYMTELLEAASCYVGKGMFKGIRISTRPDYISSDVLSLLNRYGVTAIELGAQSLDNRVLELNERGHTAEDVVKASGLIKSYGFELGLQMMVGLYGSTAESEYKTAETICSISPDTVRIYPVVILRGTKLGDLFLSGEYKPYGFDDSVDITADLIRLFEQEGIRVIKVGLHASELVERDMLGGFYHPAYRELCEGRAFRKKFEQLFDEYKTDELKVSVRPKDMSKALGHKKENIEYFSSRSKKLVVTADASQKEKIAILR